MKLIFYIITLSYPAASMADLQSEFHDRFAIVGASKVASPEKMKVALKMIEKKVGSSVVASQNMQSDPYLADIDSKKYRFYIDQLIFAKFKNNTLCRARLETFQSQPTYRALKVLCIDQKSNHQYFDETL